MKSFSKGLLALALIASSSSVFASSAYLVTRGSIEFGGDELATVYFDDGDDETTRAGEGIYVSIGGGIDHSPTWQSHLTVGYKFGGSEGDNGDLELTSFPFELMTYHRAPTGNWRAGAGVVYVSDMSLESSGVIDGIDVDFEDAMGYVIEANWYFRNYQMMYWGVRGTIIEYETEETGSKVDGNNLGLLFGVSF